MHCCTAMWCQHEIWILRIIQKSVKIRKCDSLIEYFQIERISWGLSYLNQPTKQRDQHINSWNNFRYSKSVTYSSFVLYSVQAQFALAKKWTRVSSHKILIILYAAQMTVYCLRQLFFIFLLCCLHLRERERERRKSDHFSCRISWAIFFFRLITGCTKEVPILPTIDWTNLKEYNKFKTIYALWALFLLAWMLCFVCISFFFFSYSNVLKYCLVFFYCQCSQFEKQQIHYISSLECLAKCRSFDLGQRNRFTSVLCLRCGCARRF